MAKCICWMIEASVLSDVKEECMVTSIQSSVSSNIHIFENTRTWQFLPKCDQQSYENCTEKPANKRVYQDSNRHSHRIIRDICHNQPYATMNGSSSIVVKSSACHRHLMVFKDAKSSGRERTEGKERKTSREIFSWYKILYRSKLFFHPSRMIVCFSGGLSDLIFWIPYSSGYREEAVVGTPRVMHEGDVPIATVSHWSVLPDPLIWCQQRDGTI